MNPWPPRSPSMNESPPHSKRPVLIGGRVRIRNGPFAGKEGTVTALDAKGQARVSLGLLTARVELRDLITLAEGSA